MWDSGGVEFHSRNHFERNIIDPDASAADRHDTKIDEPCVVADFRHDLAPGPIPGSDRTVVHIVGKAVPAVRALHVEPHLRPVFGVRKSNTEGWHKKCFE